MLSPSPQLTLTSRKESITIDIDNGESSSDPLDLVEEEMDKQEPETEQEPEATTEDELLDKVNREETSRSEARMVQREDEDECEESESCSVSLGSRKQIQSLPATPRSSNSTRSSHQSEESVSSSKHLLSSNSSPKVEQVHLHQLTPISQSNVSGGAVLQ